MEPSEALGIAAQVAVTLAGFAGIVVVFRPQSVHEWSALDRLRLHLLLSNSALPLLHALFGMLLLAVDPPPVGIWRWCSAFALASQLPFAIASARAMRAISAAASEAMNPIVFYPVAMLGAAAMVLQAINLARWNQFWPFFFGIFGHLAAAILQFLRLVLLPPHREER